MNRVGPTVINPLKANGSIGPIHVVHDHDELFL